VGSVRVGVARSDATGTLAVPECTLDGRKDWISELARLVADNQPIEVIVGLPVSLDGKEHAAAQRVRAVVEQIASACPDVPLRLVDERLTTTTAHAQFREAGVSTRKGRGLVDQAAAVIMLQNALDAERAGGQPPGTLANGPA
jgi:putative Holliday junction resolvase